MMKENTLPEGWIFWILDDAVQKWSSNISLNKIKDNNWDYPIFKAKWLEKHISFYHQENPYLAIIKDWAGIWRVWIYPAKSSVVWTMQYLIPREWFEINFIYYFLLWINFEDYRNWSTIPHIYYKDYKNIKFPLINRNEQKRIVKILDEVFENLEEAKNIAEENLKNAKDLFDSYLENIFEKKGEDWEEKKLADVCEKITDGSHNPPKWVESGWMMLSWRNIWENWLILDKVRFLLHEDFNKENKRTDVQIDDVLLSIVWTIWRSMVYSKNEPKVTFQRSVALFKWIKENPHFLNYYFKSSIFQKILIDESRWVAQKWVYLKTLRELNFIYPRSSEKQKIIVGKLDELSNEIKKIDAVYKEKSEKLEELKKSILERAFAGEL